MSLVDKIPEEVIAMGSKRKTSTVAQVGLLSYALRSLKVQVVFDEIHGLLARIGWDSPCTLDIKKVPKPQWMGERGLWLSPIYAKLEVGESIEFFYWVEDRPVYRIALKPANGESKALASRALSAMMQQEREEASRLKEDPDRGKVLSRWTEVATIMDLILMDDSLTHEQSAVRSAFHHNKSLIGGEESYAEFRDRRFVTLPGAGKLLKLKSESISWLIEVLEKKSIAEAAEIITSRFLGLIYWCMWPEYAQQMAPGMLRAVELFYEGLAPHLPEPWDQRLRESAIADLLGAEARELNCRLRQSVPTAHEREDLRRSQLNADSPYPLRDRSTPKRVPLRAWELSDPFRLWELPEPPPLLE